MLLLLPACYSCLRVYIVYLRRLARKCTVHLCSKRVGFTFECKSIKTQAPGCAHMVRVLLLAGTVCTSIKFKSSCTVFCQVCRLCGRGQGRSSRRLRTKGWPTSFCVLFQHFILFLSLFRKFSRALFQLGFYPCS